MSVIQAPRGQTRIVGILGALTLSASLGPALARAAEVPPVPGWSPPRVLAPHVSGSTTYSAPVVANAGTNAAVAWIVKTSATRAVLQLSERHGPAAGWTRPSRIPLPGSASSPLAVAVNGRGDAVVLVLAGDGNASRFLALVRRGVRGRWRSSAVSRVTTLGSTRLALDAAGRATVAWTQIGTAGPFVVRVARAAVGHGRWRISRDVLRVPASRTRGILTVPSLALNARGQLLVGWRDPSGAGTTLLSAFRGTAGPWRAPEEIGEGDPASFGPSVALSPGGSAIAGWAGPQGVTAPQRVTVRPRQALIWPAAAVLGMTDSGGGPFLALSDRGDALATWPSGMETTGVVQVFAALRPPGGAWPAPTLLHARDTRDSSLSVRVDGAGLARDGTAFVFIDEEESASPGATLAAVAANGGAWSVQGIYQGARPEFAVSENGSVVVVWATFDGPVVEMQFTPARTTS